MSLIVDDGPERAGAEGRVVRVVRQPCYGTLTRSTSDLGDTS